MGKSRRSWQDSKQDISMISSSFPLLLNRELNQNVQKSCSNPVIEKFTGSWQDTKQDSLLVAGSSSLSLNQDPIQDIQKS